MFLLDINKITLCFSICYVVIILTLVFILEFIIKGAFRIDSNKYFFTVYCNSVDRFKNTFEFFFYPLFGIYLLIIYSTHKLEFIYAFIGIVVLLYYIRIVLKLKKNKGEYFNIPYRQLEIIDIGFLVNDKFLVHESEKERVELVIKKLSTSRSIYYSIEISNYYNSIEFIKPIPSYQYKEFLNKLTTFFSDNGIRVSVKEIE